MAHDSERHIQLSFKWWLSRYLCCTKEEGKARSFTEGGTGGLVQPTPVIMGPLVLNLRDSVAVPPTQLQDNRLTVTVP